MNKRIRELIRQAGGIKYDDDNKEMLPMLVGSAVQKFAELIVQECYAWAQLNGGLGEECDYTELKQHFGIKE
jgi:hypothetical protein